MLFADNRFHVAAKNYPIPEPPKVGRYAWHSVVGKNELRLHPDYTRKTPQAEIDRDEAEKTRNRLVKELNENQKLTKLRVVSNQSDVQDLVTIDKDCKMGEEKMETWRRRYVCLDNKKYKLRMQLEQMAKEDNEYIKMPTMQRDENRLLRQKVYDLEVGLVRRKDDFRKLRIRPMEDEGVCVVEMRRLASVNNKLDRKIQDLSKERDKLQEILEPVSEKLGTELTELIKTNGLLFSGATNSGNTKGYDQNNNVIQSCNIYGEEESASSSDEGGEGVDPMKSTHMAIERSRIRRKQIEETVNTLEEKLGADFKFQNLRDLPSSVDNNGNCSSAARASTGSTPKTSILTPIKAARSRKSLALNIIPSKNPEQCLSSGDNKAVPVVAESSSSMGMAYNCYPFSNQENHPRKRAPTTRSSRRSI